MPDISINSQYPYSSCQIDEVNATVSGHLCNLDEIIFYLNTNKRVDATFYSLIEKNRKDFSLILMSESYVFAMVDRIKSHPIYYTIHSEIQYVSNCAADIYLKLPNVNLSRQSLIEFRMAGYVIGPKTLYDEIQQLQAGELLFWRQEDDKPQIHRYYRYLPEPKEQVNMDDVIDQFGQIFDSIIDDLIVQANGRPIFVPLSGGLDSRFILAKLVEKKYDHITAFTYGINRSHEMQCAKSVTKELGVTWLKLPSNTRRAFEIFSSTKRQDYEHYSHEFTTIPFYGEFEVLTDLIEKSLISEDALIVNGQSGDFITGGHVRVPILNHDATLDDIFNYIINKHFSLWLPEKTSENIDRIKTYLHIQYDEFSSTPNFPNFYEFWEWQERQCKNVIRGQRLYEFFGFSWSLPFWHADLMDFYRNIPYSLKFKQYLYIEYLRRYNYKNLFHILRKKVHPWVVRYRWIPIAAKFIQLARGYNAKQNYYRRKDYYSTYHHQYALYGQDYFLKYYKASRNPESLILRDLLDRLYL